MRWLIASIVMLCASLIGAAASTPAAEPIAEFPYRIEYQGWITVGVMVNGHGPYDFIVDSGATITSAFANLAEQENFERADRPPIRVLGLTDAKRLPAFRFGELELGGQRMHNHVGVVLPDWPPPLQSPHGVLGLDFLTRYTVLFDAGDKMVRLYDRANAPPEMSDAWTDVPLKADDFGQDGGMLYRVTVDMQGRPIPCLLDLGASGTLLNYPALKRLMTGIFINQSRDTGFSTGTRLNDIFANTEEARQVRVTRVRIGAATWRNRTFVVFDAPIFEELGVGRKPFCLVGSDLMIERSFMFDFAHEKLYIDRAKRRRPARTG